MLGSRSGRNGSRERSREKSPLREAEGEKQTTSMGSPVFLIPAMFLVLRWKIMFLSWFLTVVMLLPREQEGGNKAKKKKERPVHGKGITTLTELAAETHTRPHAPIALKQSARLQPRTISCWASSQSSAPLRKDKEVFKLPLSYPNYMLFLINQHHRSLPQGLMLSCQVRGCLLRLNKGNVVTEVFRPYSKCWRWQGLWILVNILQFFSPQEVVFTQEACGIRPLFTQTCVLQPNSLLQSHSFFGEKWW